MPTHKEESGCRKDGSGEVKARFGALNPGISDATGEHNNQGDNQNLHEERSAPADCRR